MIKFRFSVIFFVDLFLIYSNNAYFSRAMMRRMLAISFEKNCIRYFFKKEIQFDRAGEFEIFD